MQDKVLDYFRQQGQFTKIGSHRRAISNVAGDVGVLVQIIQGLLLHDGFAARYGLEHVAGLYHHVGDILDRSLDFDPRPITVPAVRLMGVPADTVMSRPRIIEGAASRSRGINGLNERMPSFRR